MKFDIIISSPLLRASHIAKILNINGNEIIYDNRISERSCGDLSGKPIEVTNREEYWNYYTKVQYGTEDKVIFRENIWLSR